MTGATLDQLKMERDFHKEMVGVHERFLKATETMITETEAVHKKFQKGLGGGKVSIPKTPGRKGRPPGSKINKSEEIRQIFRKNAKAGNKDVVALLAKNDIAVTDGLVSIIRKKFFADGEGKSGKTAKKTRGKGGKKATPAAAKNSASAKNSAKNSRGELKVIIKKILGKPGNKQGLKLADLTEEIVKAGYKTASKKGRDGLPQIVYQTLLAMKKDGKLIVHNKQSHRYRLKRKRAA